MKSDGELLSVVGGELPKEDLVVVVILITPLHLNFKIVKKVLQLVESMHCLLPIRRDVDTVTAVATNAAAVIVSHWFGSVAVAIILLDFAASNRKRIQSNNHLIVGGGCSRNVVNDGDRGDRGRFNINDNQLDATTVTDKNENQQSTYCSPRRQRKRRWQLR